MTTKYTLQKLEEAVHQSESFAGVLRYLGVRQAGGSQSWITKKIREYDIDTSHFTGQAWNRGKISSVRKSASEILVRLPEDSQRTRHKVLKRALIESNIPYECGMKDCPSPEPIWAGKSLTLEIDHIDGDWCNNLLENLRFACPNCHSQEPTNRPWKHAALSQRQRTPA